jgi:hypothetical protein
MLDTAFWEPNCLVRELVFIASSRLWGMSSISRR